MMLLFTARPSRTIASFITAMKDLGHMDIQITIDDPKAYTKPWTFMEHVRLSTDTELMEAVCNENNRDLQHLPGENSR